MGERDLSVARAAYGDGPAARARSGSIPSPSSGSVASGAGVAAVAAAPSVSGGSPGAERPRLTALPAWSTDDMRRRVHELVNEYMDFVWRSLRRLGVAEADCDDGCQRVWVVLAQKLESIEPTKVRSYVFSVVVRVASEMRRNYRRHQHVEFDELCVEPGRPDAEGLVEQQRVRQLLDQILAGLSWDLRTVFVMYEIEGMSSPEIAEVLGISRGTVASRLRLGREAFQRSLQRYRARARGAGAAQHFAPPSLEPRAARSPAAKVPAAKSPAAKLPAAKLPATKLPAAELPAAELPAARSPATQSLATQPPAARPPTIKPPGARS
jgi:RNA polymerase sigma-70 factor (ECF subfamily)